ncbi:MAG: carbohydrate ABC transporter permease [Chloroflexota bacterium]|nr:carbohydrate ABC transporter permease [Chloroflexota bacterium]
MDQKLPAPSIPSQSRVSTSWNQLLGALARLSATGILLLWTAFTIFAFLWIIVSSFKDNQELFTSAWSLPSTLHFENYQKAWSVVRMGDYFLNSIVVVGISTAAIVAVSAPAAYVLSRVPFRGREVVSNSFIIGMGVPYQLLLVPLFVLLSGIRLVDTLPGLMVVYVALSLPFTIFLLTGFFRSLPSELEDSAAIDGASEYQVFYRVMLPLASPGIITAAIFNFIGLWNEYMLALVMINDQDKRTLSLGLYGLQGSMQYTSDWVGLFAGVVIVMVPTLILFIVMSERVIEGITLGATKG